MSDLFASETCPTCHGSGQVLAHSFAARTARTSDPETSKQAGARHAEDVRIMRAGTLKHRMLLEFLTDDLTAQEAAYRCVGVDATVSEIEGARRRVSDLRRAGYVQAVGLRNNEHGGSAMVFHLTDSGCAVLAHLGGDCQ